MWPAVLGFYIFVIENLIFVDEFAVKVKGSDVIPGIYVIVKTRSYRIYHLILN